MLSKTSMSIGLTNLTLRKLTLKDLDRVARLEKNFLLPLLTFSYSKDQIKIVLSAGMSWGLFDGDKLVGKVNYEKRENNSLEMGGFVLINSYRGLGLGKRLVKETILKALNLKPNELFLLTHPKNAKVVVIATKLGFVITEYIENKLGDPRLKMVYQAQ